MLCKIPKVFFSIMLQLPPNLLALKGEMPNKGIKDSAFRLARARSDEADASVDDDDFAGLVGEF